MLVKDWMCREFITVEKTDTIGRAVTLMKENHVRSLPVISRGKPVGLLSIMDLEKRLLLDRLVPEADQAILTVDQIVGVVMGPILVTVSPFATIDEAAAILLNTGMPALPVIDEDGNLSGIVTEKEIFSVFASLAGLQHREFDFGFQVADTPGSIKEITDIIRDHTGRIGSILISYDKAPEGFRNVYIRVYGIERDRLKSLKNELCQKTRMLYMFDHIDASKVIF